MIVFSLIFLSGFLMVHSAPNKVVCFYNSQSSTRPGNGLFTLADIDVTLCTHLVYMGAIPFNSDGSLPQFSGDLTQSLTNFAAVYNRNPNLKMMVSIGGTPDYSATFSAIAASANARSAFATNLFNRFNPLGFHGIDIDWQYPNGATDKANFVLMLQDLKAGIGALLLSVTLAANVNYWTNSYNPQGINAIVDMINLKTFEYHLTSETVTGHHTPLYAAQIDTTAEKRKFNTENSISNWIALLSVGGKINLGIASFGLTYTLKSSTSTAIGAAASGPGTAGALTTTAGFLAYYEICVNNAANGWTPVDDAYTYTPYSYKATQWVSYDKPGSVTTKVQFAQTKNLGGIMVESIDTDDFRGLCGQTYPLLRAIAALIPITVLPPIPQPPAVDPALLCLPACEPSELGWYPSATPGKVNFCAVSANGEECVAYEFDCAIAVTIQGFPAGLC